MLPIAKLSIGGQVRHGGVTASRPCCFIQRIGKAYRGAVVAGHVGVGHGRIGIALQKQKQLMSQL